MCVPALAGANNSGEIVEVLAGKPILVAVQLKTGPVFGVDVLLKVTDSLVFAQKTVRVDDGPSNVGKNLKSLIVML